MRIVAGAARGRRLATPPAGTRPTSDRVREALFSSLAASVHLDGARVLDLFAGTGAVGLEALSRGAAEAVLVEKGRAALDVLRRNVDTVGLPGASVVARPVGAFLAEGTEQPFDVVFADPPYALDLAKLCEVVAGVAAGWLARDGVVVVEHGARSAGPGACGLTCVTSSAEKRYGDTVLWYGRAR